VTSSVCSFVAAMSTIHRLWIRRDRLWADDGWAVFSMLALFLQVAAVFMHLSETISKLNRVAAYYLMAVAFYIIIWSARLSILFSIMRLDQVQSSRRRLLTWVAFLFMGVCVLLICQLFWVCELLSGWKDISSPQCALNKQVAISQLVSDLIADLILILTPLKILSELRNKQLRLRLMSIFSTCIVTTMVSLIHAIYILNSGGIKVVIAALVEDCMSLSVCNVPVVFTAIFKL
ncbi:hypothetical protein M422DRAFT_139424, partial [Sphaerobolus stellatus SS14]